MCALQRFLHSLTEMLNTSDNNINNIDNNINPFHLQSVQLVNHHILSPVIQNFIHLTGYMSSTHKDHNFLTNIQEYCRRQYQKPWWRQSRWYSMLSSHLWSQPFQPRGQLDWSGIVYTFCFHGINPYIPI